MAAYLTRRLFLTRSAGAVGAIAATAATLPAASGPFQGKVRKAVKLHMVQGKEMSVLDKFRLLRELGFDGVELRARGGVDVREVLAARNETGLVVHGVTNSSDPDFALPLIWRSGLAAILCWSSQAG